jgi:hypothetical protein
MRKRKKLPPKPEPLEGWMYGVRRDDNGQIVPIAVVERACQYRMALCSPYSFLEFSDDYFAVEELRKKRQLKK